ncbi:MAG TPA: FtsX-like permease family protein, partial [Myxococcales bacterium]|nr:FtsX-like permease family protein [Myxococcales bacterium]
ALTLVSGAALLLRSFARLTRTDPGFEASGAVTLQAGIPGDNAHLRTTFRSVLQRLRSVPGSMAVGGIDYQPLSGVANDNTFDIEGRPVPAGAQPPDEEIRIVTDGWFEAMRIPLLAGRPPREADTPDAAPVVFVNKSFAQKYWSLDTAIGQRLHLTNDSRWWTVTGVVGDVREFGLDADIRPTMYFPFDQLPNDTLNLVVRSHLPAPEMLRAAQQVLFAADPRGSAYQARSLSEMLAGSLAQRTFALTLLHGFAAIALALAGLGLYGVLAYTVAQRTREIGVRMALGAAPAQALALVARESAVVVGAGLLLGLAGALVTARLFAGLLFGVGPADPISLIAALVVLAGVAAGATLLPARRAARVDPVVALRAE